MRNKIKGLEPDCFGMVIVIGAICLIAGILIGFLIADQGRLEVEKVQQEIRLDVKDVGQLVKEINGFFHNRDKIIDWNRNHVVLTVVPEEEQK